VALDHERLDSLHGERPADGQSDDTTADYCSFDGIHVSDRARTAARIASRLFHESTSEDARRSAPGTGPIGAMYPACLRSSLAPVPHPLT